MFLFFQCSLGVERSATDANCSKYAISWYLVVLLHMNLDVAVKVVTGLRVQELKI